MGTNTSCLADNQITKHQSISEEETKHKKIYPLQYIQPLDLKNTNTLINVTQEFERIAEKQNKQNLFSNSHIKGSDESKSAQQQKNIDHDIVKVKWDKFIKMKRRNFQEDYKIINEIGRGGFGCVYKVVMKNGEIERAAKKINKDKLKKDEHENLLAQMAIMMSLDHPNITKLYEVYDQKSYYVMVLQLCDGGELFEKIVNQSVKQSQAKSIVRQVLSALHYIHQKGIIHRDIKPENMLFQKRTNLVKIIDFGISSKYKMGDFLTTRVGTPYYIAPEVLYRKYNQKSDIWSLGVVLYMILFNEPPFKGKSAVEVMQNVLKDQISFKGLLKSKFSSNALHFLKSLLIKDPNNRPSAKQALEHEWLKRKSSSNQKLSIEEKQDQVLERISKFHFKNKLQAVVHTFIVSQLLTSEQRLELLDVFRQLDQNQNGIIDNEQIKQALTKKKFQQLDEKKLAKIIDYIDTNCSGHIDYTQFLVAAIDFDKKVTEKHFQQAFSYFDIDNSGQITFQQVAKFLQNQVASSEQIKQMFKTVDKNGDGVISKKEFVELLVNHKTIAL